MKILNSANQNNVLQAAAALQNLVTGIISLAKIIIINISKNILLEATIPGLVRAGAYETIIKICKANAGYLPRFAPTFAILLIDGIFPSNILVVAFYFINIFLQ